MIAASRERLEQDGQIAARIPHRRFGIPRHEEWIITPGRAVIVQEPAAKRAVVEVEGVVDQDHRMIIVEQRLRRREQPDGLDGVGREHGNE